MVRVSHQKPCRGGSGLFYLYLARVGYFRNTVYTWSHMIQNVASSLFGFLYISLWQAVAPEASTADPYTRGTMTSIVVLAQTFAWATSFLPAGLNIHTSVRSGAIAMDMARPVPYFPMVLTREAGNIAYQVAWRSIPMGLLFAVTVGFPRPASAMSLLLTVPSLALGAVVGLCLVYTVGISSLWTVEVRWAHWLYWTILTLMSGGWIPSDILPGWLGRVAPLLPFSAQMFYPIRIYLGLSGAEVLLIQAAWVILLVLWTHWLTQRAFRRVMIQGG